MARRRKSDSERTFSCPECGNRYTAYPPDDNHDRAALDEQEAKDNASGTIIKIVHDCENEHCRRPITLYWYRQKMGGVIV